MSNTIVAVVGRPSEFDPAYIAIALDYMGDQGKSITQLARHLRVSKQSIYNWMDKYPEFLDALKMAQEWGQGYWEDRLEDMMTDRSANAPLVKLYFSNRFGWTDRSDEEKKSEPITINIVKPKGAD
jgi:hypothetical protein